MTYGLPSKYYSLSYAYVSYLTDLAVAKFTDEACKDDGVNPNDPLLFICTIYDTLLLRLVLPTGDPNIVFLDNNATVIMPAGFTKVSLDITKTDDDTRNFNLTLSIDSVSRLKGGNITCDDTTEKSATARCPIGKLSPSQCLGLYV